MRCVVWGGLRAAGPCLGRLRNPRSRPGRNPRSSKGLSLLLINISPPPALLLLLLPPPHPIQTTPQVPADASVLDLTFQDTPDSHGGFHDDNKGLDYHVDLAGATAPLRPLRVVHVASEMAPIAKVGRGRGWYCGGWGYWYCMGGGTAGRWYW